MSAYRPIFSVSRGGQPESLHFGAIAVVRAGGDLIAAYGDAQESTFLRSSAKPFQALPFVLAGGVEQYGLTPEELAMLCASHSGTDEHLRVVASIQQKTGITEDLLQCGAHAPMDKASATRLRESGATPGINHNNCSGKHSGMLAFAKLRGWSLENYIDPKHPLQQEIFSLFAEIAGLSTAALTIAVDGCSAPNWAAPLYNSALAYARLMDPKGLPATQAKACKQVVEAMIANPNMVAGPGRFDTELMRVGAGRILSKGGAEGYQAIALRPGALGDGSPAMGIAVKISDGDARGWAREAVSLEVLRQLGVLSARELQQLATFGPQRTVSNWAGLEVGRAEPVFDLESE
jgi:L-asparaginase II